MIAKAIPLRDDNASVCLEIYLLKNSTEFQTGKKRPAVIICPGGAYLGTSDREAEPMALRFLARGYHAFVVRYSVRTPFPAPMIDLAKALLIVRSHADEWFINPERVAVCGFSAGGHLAATLGVHWNKPFLCDPLGVSGAQIRPDALILGYPAIDLLLVDEDATYVNEAGETMRLNDVVLTYVLGQSNPEPAVLDHYRADLHVTPETPPTFIWHTANDALVYARNALQFATALADHKVPYELHIFESGVHGLSLADETTDQDQQFINPGCQVWIDLALNWLKLRGFSC